MPQRIDLATLKHDHPIAEVVAGYGIELRPSGHALVGRCPFHLDRGRPNLHVYASTQSWYCYRCAEGGDVIRFVERIAGVDFREALAILDGKDLAQRVTAPRAVLLPKARSSHADITDLAERACLAAAVEVYHNRLLAESRALAYLEGRGIDRATIEACRLGFAAGDDLLSYLRWLRLPIRAAVRAGLLRHDGREFLAGRVVVPEMREGQPVWLIGRTIDPDDPRPKYLGLPGRKPLLGWERAASEREVWVVEGVFDLLALRSWGIPVLALLGTQLPPEHLQTLARFSRVYLALDNDPAGHDATERLVHHLGERAVVVSLEGVKDIADLARLPDGRAIFSRFLNDHHATIAA